jgi:hypothetical protein
MERVVGILLWTALGTIGALCFLVVISVAVSLVMVISKGSPIMGVLAIVVIIAGGVVGGLFAWRTA